MSQFHRRSSAPLARKESGRDYPAPILAPGRLLVAQGIRMYNWPSIDSNNVIEPGLDWQLEVRVPQDLKAERVAVVLTLRGVAVQAGHEAVECVEHGRWESPRCCARPIFGGVEAL